MADSNNIQVILMTGVTSTVNAQGQVDLFKKGYGENTNIDQYSYTDYTGLKKSVESNPGAVVVLYSAGGKVADDIAKVIEEKNKLFVVEPWCGDGTKNAARIKIMKAAMTVGVPPTNFQSGPRFSRGKGIPGSTKTPDDFDHFESLTWAGERIKGIFPPEEVQPPLSKKVLDEPTYIVYTTNSTIDGEMIFTQQEEGYGGELYLSNFPDGLNVDLKGRSNKFFYSSFIDDADFDRLKDGLIKRGNEWLSELSAFDGNENFDAGEIKIGAINGRRYKLKGIVVDELSKEGIAGALIKDSTIDPSETKSKSDGSFTLTGYYEVTEKPSKDPIYNLTIDDNSNVTGTIKFEGTAAILRLTGKTPDQKPITLSKTLFFDKKGRTGGVEIDDPSVNNENGEDSMDAFEEASNDLVELAEIDLLTTLQYTTSITKKLIPPSNKPPTPDFTLTVSSKGFSQKTNVSPFNLIGNLKSSILVPLTPSKIQLEENIQDALPLEKGQVFSIEASKMTPEMAQQKFMNKIILEAKTRLLPAIFVLIGEFGITNIQAALGKQFGDMNASCPASLEELNKLIEKKNNLTRALNKIYNALEKIEFAVGIADKILTAADIVVGTLQTTTLLPITPAFAANLLEEAKKRIKKYKLLTFSTLLILAVLIQIVQLILKYLEMLDFLIQGCAEKYEDLDDDGNNTLAVQQAINQDLLKATQKQAKQLSPVVTNVNGFDMDVITENGETEFDLKRRRAIAKNKAGIIMLKGEPSFSSNDQILIDELVFYIKQNDLKAE
mgnify:CR=1 FL=1